MRQRCVERKLAGYALQHVPAVVLETDPRSGHEIPDRPRDKHLAGAGLGGHTSGDVHGDPADIICQQLALAGVQPRAHFDAEIGRRAGDSA